MYFVAVALARRAGAALPRRIAVLFFALALFFFREALMTDAINVAVDYYETLPPWSNLHNPIRSANPFINDVSLQLVPWAHAVREHWRSLELPLWEASAASGYPLLANAQSQALSILRLMSLPLSLGHAMAAEGAWKVLIAMTFTFLFCRRRWSVIASTVAAIAYGFSGFVIVWLHFGHATVAAMLPAALLAVDLLSESQSRAAFAFGALVWAAILTGGHPETAAQGGILALAFTLWIAFAERHRERLRFIAASVLSMITGALLASPFLIPFAEAVRKTKRFADLSVAPHPAGVLADWASTIATLQPHFFGNIPSEHPWGPALPETITGFAGTLAVIAAIALTLRVIAAKAWRSREAFLVLALILTLGVMYDVPGITGAFNLVMRLTPAARVRCLLALLTAICIAPAIDGLMHGFRWPVLAGSAVASLLFAAMMRFPFPHAADREGALIALIPAMCVAAVGAIATLRPARIAIAVLAIAMLSEQWSVLRGWNPVLPPSRLYPPTPLVRKLVALKAAAPPTAPFRIAAYGADFFPNLSTMYGLEDIRAHDPMESARYTAMLGLCGGYDTATYFAMWTNTTTTLLDYLNVRYFVTSPGRTLDSPRWSRVYEGRDGFIFENRDVLPRFYATRTIAVEWNVKRFVERMSATTEWAHTAVLEDLRIDDAAMRRDLIEPHAGADATVEITHAEASAYAMRVNAPRHTLVASSIPWWPGWQVRVDGRGARPLRINGAFLGFLVRPGPHDVRVFYRPWSFWAGVAVSMITAAVLFVRRKHAYPADRS